MLSQSPSLEEILWNFSRFRGRRRLTLRDNPHFYAELPTSLDAFGDSIKIDPTDDFRHAAKFYVLVDKLKLVHIMTDQGSQSFGNFWCPNNAVIFKGLGIFFCFPPVSDILPDICGTLRGERIIMESLRGAYCRFCKQLPRAMSIVRFLPRWPRASTDHRRLRPIITKGYPRMGWEFLIGCLPMHSSVDIGLRVCTGEVAPDSPVRCKIITYSPASANLDIDPGVDSPATNV